MSTLTTNYLTPTGREEAWRFTPLKRLGGLHDGTAVIADRKSLSLKGTAADGVSFERISRELAAPLSDSDDAVVGRIRENAADVAVLTIKANTEVAAPPRQL
jgi:Fe-S cluster assembly protein SufD